MRILIVDDNEDARLILRRTLESNGYHVEATENGSLALEKAQLNPPDMIISDILMPVMDGFMLCREVRLDPALQHIPFLFYSANYTDEQDEKLAFELGADRYIRKPVDPADFLNEISSTIATVKKGRIQSALPDPKDEAIFKLYSERLVNKLESKMQELEQEITTRKQTESELRESEEKYRSLVESSMDQIFLLSPDGVYLESNDRVEQFGLNKGSELIGKRLEDVYGEDAGAYRMILEAVAASQSAQKFNHKLSVASGRTVEHEDTLYPILRDGRLWAIGGICRDITEQKQLESQLRQAQKMEAVGRLAGGVAHDFNNMLGIISGYTELALNKISPADLIREDLDEVLKAAGRSADLTRQLLAFARRQAIAPRVINLNASIESSKKMLLRLLGEDINLRFIPGDELWPILFDASQVDQILANLCINARDAITGVGDITIETENIVSDDNYCRFHLDFTPGEYVLLRFSDSGAGMDKKTQESIFEPFFTTKEVGRGTGLGLATVYGIVRQNKGFIYVYSEPGRGTSFQIYIPRYQGPDDKASKEKREDPAIKTMSPAGSS
jgi:PAS domain S-box-containing protein